MSSHRTHLLLALSALAAVPGAGAALAASGPARPDLSVVQVTPGAPAVAPGASLDARLATRNRGRRPAGRSSTRLWLSRDARRGAGDVVVGRVPVARLAARRTAPARSRVAIPAGTAPGAYRLIACADGGGRVREAREQDNCRTSRTAIAVRAPGPAARPGVAAPVAPPAAGPSAAPAAPPAPQPPAAPAAPPAPQPQPTPPSAPTGGDADLAVSDVSDPPATAREGGRFRLLDVTRETGDGAPASATRFYLSPDSAAGLARRRASDAHPRTALEDVLLAGARELPDLPAGAESRSPEPGTEVAVPVGTRPGPYHLLACADDRGAVAEREEGDNCAVATRFENGEERPSTITILAEEQDYRVDALSDVFEDANADDEADLERGRPLFCDNPLTGSVGSAGEAVARVRAYLTETAGADAMAAFAASPEHADADRAVAAAAAAVTAERPGAALAALVRAHELEPGQASHLENAAAVAAGVGLPAEALAMLDEARRLDDPDRPAGGLSRHAVELTNRGQALAMLGRHGEAEAALKAAVDAEPLLAEAEESRSGSVLCREGAEAAVKHRRRGRTRQGPKPLDPSRGRESSLRPLELPGFPKQAATMKPYYQSQSRRLLAEIDDRNARAAAISERLRAKQADWTPAQRNRYRGTFDRLYAVAEQPAVVAAEAEMERHRQVVRDTEQGFWGQGQTDDHRYAQISAGCSGPDFDRCMVETCRPELRLVHQEWLDEMEAYRDASQVYFRLLSRGRSGVAAHLRDPDAHAQALLVIEGDENGRYGSLIQQAFMWTHEVGLHADHCVEAPEAATAAEQEAGAVDSPGACATSLKGMSAVVKLGPTELKVNCEEVQQSVKLEVLPWLSAFAEVGYHYKTGKVTVVVGTQAEVSAGVAKGAFKSGIYITMDKYGLGDVGWRVGPSATVGAGPVEFEAFKDEYDLKIIGSTRPTLGP